MGVSSRRHRLVFDSFLVTHGLSEPAFIRARMDTHAHTDTHGQAGVYVAATHVKESGRRGTQIARGTVPLTYSTIITHYSPIAGAGACALTSVANYTSSRKGGRGAGT